MSAVLMLPGDEVETITEIRVYLGTQVEITTNTGRVQRIPLPDPQLAVDSFHRGQLKRVDLRNGA